MAGDTTPTNYKALFLQAEERRKQAEERRKQAEEEGARERERTRQTSFEEFISFCHNLLSQAITVRTPSRSTTGTIPAPTGKYCPTRLELWTDCEARQQELYRSVCSYLQPTQQDTPRLFPPRIELEGMRRRFVQRPMSSEQDLETYERIAVEDHVRDIIAELCKIPAARDEFGLGDGIWFDNHTNSLANDDKTESRANELSTIHRPRPDQFCIHRVDGNASTILTTVEYKPPHKLSLETLRAGLRPMKLWEAMVRSNKIPTDPAEKLRYNAERLVCSAIVQEYHVMIQEGLEYSYLTNGIARVLLHIPYDEPTTLYYFLCDPHSEIDADSDWNFQQQKTSVARVLCLCLMAFHSCLRDQEWRNAAKLRLHVWKTSFDHTRSLIPKEDLQQSPPQLDSTDSEHVSPDPTSEYQPSSSPPESPSARARRVPTRSQTSCAPCNLQRRSGSPDSSGSDANRAADGRKRRLSQVTSSPSAQRAARQRGSGHRQRGQSGQHTEQFCTQRCLIGLQNGGLLDDCCPNVICHRQAGDGHKHPINAEDMVKSLRRQLDKNIDQRCTPLGTCGAYGAPFKLTCAAYGYTVIGKGTTTALWNTVSREAQVYRILQKAQGSAVPIFLGKIDLAKTYFLHGAGEIRHMLIMAWGGKSIAETTQSDRRQMEIRRSMKEIRALGVIHQDLRPDNILWNEELERALIIDFHDATLDPRLPIKRPWSERARSLTGEKRKGKRLRVS